MKRFPSHVAGWFPAILVIVGSLAMTVGLFSIKGLAVSPADVTIPPHAAVYVGGGTCYTCHTGDFAGWAVPVDLQAMADAAKPKQVVADVAPREEVQHVDVDASADACTSGSDAAQVSGSKPRQYVVRTDTGDALLPLQWNEQAPETPDPDEQAAESVNCAVDLPGYKSFGIQWASRSIAPHFRSSHPVLTAGNVHQRVVIRTAISSATAFVEGQSA
jgi:hypothetical protein